ncbi:MAG TPA: transcription factor S [Candidatus Nanoarchaeia archaeon]|nr:transcription factor S [Candidatus Nanoarchaeia archaeon]
MFCPKCGSILIPSVSKGKKILGCSCGYKSKDVKSAQISERVREKQEGIAVVEKDAPEHLPQVDAECSKCGHGKAYFWTVQTRAGDEPETKFFRCAKCKHTWRDYS